MPKVTESIPYLSVVAASRNDDHGGDPLARTQIFINTFARQCEQHKLTAELILVDWNPVPGRPGLAGVLKLPAEASYCQARIITVPAVLHDRFKYADRISFYQMIAKNVAIRRARGRFVLATNIDIIFSEELVRFISQQKLNPNKMYRVDRYDIQSGLGANLSPTETMDYAWSHPVRSNRRYEPKGLVEHLYGSEMFKRSCVPNLKACRNFDGVSVVLEDGAWSVRSKRDSNISHLHTNACGDFTLLSKEGWEKIAGYPEFEAFSFHIDSFGLASAHYAGLEEIALLPPCVCFHIEHSLGSGWTPEGEKKLFARLQENEILNPDWEVLSPLMEKMRLGKDPMTINGEGWGLAGFSLPEEALDSGKHVAAAVHPIPYKAPEGVSVTALKLPFDLDRLTLWHERRKQMAIMNQTLGYLGLVEKENSTRLKVIEDMQRQIEEHGRLRHTAEARVRELEQTLGGTRNHLAMVEADCAARLHAIAQMQQQLEEHGLARHKAEARLAEVEPALKGTTDYLMLVDADRAARLIVIQDLQRQLDDQGKTRQTAEARVLELEEMIKASRESFK